MIPLALARTMSKRYDSQRVARRCGWRGHFDAPFGRSQAPRRKYNGRNNTEVLALLIHFLSTIGSGAEDHTSVRHFRDFLTGDAVPALDYS